MRLKPAAPYRPRLRSILLLANLLVALIPLGSIYFLHIFENELVRQTESELIVQGTFAAVAYRQAIAPLLAGIAPQTPYGIPVMLPVWTDAYFRPVPTRLDLSGAEILPPRPEGVPSPQPIDALAVQAGMQLTPLLQETLRTTLAGTQILDYHGTVVTGVKEQGLSFAMLPELQQALRGEYASSLRQRKSGTFEPSLSGISRSNSLRVFVAMPIILNDQLIGAVFLSRSPRSILKALYDSKTSLLLAVILLVILTSLLALLTSYSITRPLYALIEQTRGIAAGRKGGTHVIRNPVTQEMALLSQSFSHMATTIEHRSDYIRNFTLSVSHEFKTPLTSIQATIELLQEHLQDMSAEKRERFLAMLAEDTAKLRKLLARLLQLARADVFEPSSEITEITILLKQLQGQHQELGLSICIAHEDEKIHVAIAPDVMETVLSNLFDNSRQHGASEVAVDIDKAGEEIRLTLNDNGPGIAPEHIDKLFTPFYTTRRDTGGTGLGLVIVRALLSAHRGTITYVPGSAGACFVISLPILQYSF